MARNPDLAGLPNWPRLLTRLQAASYLGLTVNSFNLGMEEGTWPDPITYGRSKLWDRRRLDEAVDMLSGYSIEAHERDVEEEDRKRRRDAWTAHRRRGK
ncbi:hypothetical protein [Azospirillum doebereinerae]|uniref:Uncharacterized protein n=1 Tax=Azospirillum doebereinerae TaxID=92933 RepID=A0A3S0V4Y8_9PROT|nr:hypothetical protein [Azospirillum doebereinerae]RUQ67474.1 hypothetical protein EJ913_19830 [Azospirillum doebereinerae]